jgi:hypothetical protein
MFSLTSLQLGACKGILYPASLSPGADRGASSAAAASLVAVAAAVVVAAAAAAAAVLAGK